MRSRRLILCLILLTVVAFGLLAAAKVRATPKFDRIEPRMTEEEVRAILGDDYKLTDNGAVWNCDEGIIFVQLYQQGPHKVVLLKQITRNGPINRLMGWRIEPEVVGIPGVAPSWRHQ